jgi:hypothetical protein
MRLLTPTRPKQLAIVATAAVLGACGGANVEGRYTPRGDALFESLTILPEGRVDVVFIGQPAQGTYVIDDNAITMTAPNGDKVLFVLGDDGCLTNSIIGAYCRSGDAPASTGSGAAVAGGGGASGPEAWEATTEQGRIKLELVTDSQARMTMRPNNPGAAGMPAQMSIDVFYERAGEDLIVALPGEDPMQLVRDGRDYVASMNGETARFVRQ